MDESYSQPGMVNQGNYGIQGLANGTFGGQTQYSKCLLTLHFGSPQL